MTGIYVHIPFCQSRCIYCDFVSSTLGHEWQQRYIRALGGEMRARRMENGAPRARTIYIGGGTPSQLTPDCLRRLFGMLEENFTFGPDAEFTIEANPDDVTPQFIALLRESPVNRVSMGIQSTDDAVLRFLRRRHTAGHALRAIRLLQDAGLGNLSGDLIYGLPGQTEAMFEKDLETLLGTGIPHLSAYALQYEQGTALHQMLQRGEVPPEDEELSLRCYQLLMDRTAGHGFLHYEISNFARPGFHSRHNSSYWQGLPYLGFGAGAHSYDGRRTRRANTADIRAYINGAAPEAETLSPDELYDERVMLGLRTREGTGLNQLENDFGPAILRHLLRQAEPYLASGKLKKAGEQLVLTREGLFISDAIMADLMAD